MPAEQEKLKMEELWRGPLIYPLHIVCWQWPSFNHVRGRKVEVAKWKPKKEKRRLTK